MRKLQMSHIEFHTRPPVYSTKVIEITESRIRNIILHKVERGVNSRFMYTPLGVSQADIKRSLITAVTQFMLAEIQFYTNQMEALNELME